MDFIVFRCKSKAVLMLPTIAQAGDDVDTEQYFGETPLSSAEPCGWAGMALCTVGSHEKCRRRALHRLFSARFLREGIALTCSSPSMAPSPELAFAQRSQRPFCRLSVQPPPLIPAFPSQTHPNKHNTSNYPQLVDDVSEREAALVGGSGKEPVRYRWDEGGFYSVLTARVKSYFLDKHGQKGIDPRKVSVNRFVKVGGVVRGTK